MKEITKVLLIWCIMFMEHPQKFTMLWWFITSTLVLSLTGEVIEYVKSRRDNK